MQKLSDRQCKVCHQYKPDFEFRSNGSKRSFTCNECEGADAPAQPAEFAHKFEKPDSAPLLIKPTLPAAFMDEEDAPEEKLCRKCGSSFPATEEYFYRQRGSLVSPCKACQSEQRQVGTLDKPCNHPDCSEPRHVTKSGRVQSYCTKHMTEVTYTYKPQQPKQTKVKGSDDRKQCRFCRKRFPNTPEHFAPNGRGLSTTCINCQAQPQPSKRSTDAQRDQGFLREPAKVKSREMIRICIVDHKTDEMIFVDGAVTLRTKTHAGDLLPGGFDLLLESHTADGYQVFERGTLGIASRYAGRD